MGTKLDIRKNTVPILTPNGSIPVYEISLSDNRDRLFTIHYALKHGKNNNLNLSTLKNIFEKFDSEELVFPEHVYADLALRSWNKKGTEKFLFLKNTTAKVFPQKAVQTVLETMEDSTIFPGFSVYMYNKLIHTNSNRNFFLENVLLAENKLSSSVFVDVFRTANGNYSPGAFAVLSDYDRFVSRIVSISEDSFTISYPIKIIGGLFVSLAYGKIYSITSETVRTSIKLVLDYPLIQDKVNTIKENRAKFSNLLVDSQIIDARSYLETFRAFTEELKEFARIAKPYFQSEKLKDAIKDILKLIQAAFDDEEDFVTDMYGKYSMKVRPVFHAYMYIKFLNIVKDSKTIAEYRHKIAELMLRVTEKAKAVEFGAKLIQSELPNVMEREMPI